MSFELFIYLSCFLLVFFFPFFWVSNFNCSFSFCLVCVGRGGQGVNPYFACWGLSQPQRKGLPFSSQLLLIILILVVLIIMVLLLSSIYYHSLNNGYFIDFLILIRLCSLFFYYNLVLLDFLIGCKLVKSSSNVLKSILICKQ